MKNFPMILLSMTLMFSQACDEAGLTGASSKKKNSFSGGNGKGTPDPSPDNPSQNPPDETNNLDAKTGKGQTNPPDATKSDEHNPDYDADENGPATDQGKGTGSAPDTTQPKKENIIPNIFEELFNKIPGLTHNPLDPGTGKGTGNPGESPSTPDDATPATPHPTVMDPTPEFAEFEMLFEDWTDYDYDNFFCVKGQFRLTRSAIMPDRKLEIMADQTMTLIAGKQSHFDCENKLEIAVQKSTGEAVETHTMDLSPDSGDQTLTIDVQKGDFIIPTFKIGPGKLCTRDKTAGLDVSINQPHRSRMLPTRFSDCEQKILKKDE